MGRMAESKHLDKRYWELTCNAGMTSYLDAAILVSAGVALPLWVEHLGLNTWWAGAASTVLTIAVTVGSFFGGRLSDVFGRVAVFNLDILFVVVGAALIAFAPNLLVLVAGLVVAGLASGADLPTSLAALAERRASGAADAAVGASGKEQAYPLRKLLGNPRYLAPLVMLAVFYLTWNLPANTWGSFQTYFMVEVGGRSQAFATACGFLANVLAAIVTYTVFVRFADTRRRYLVMFVGLGCGILSFCVSAVAGAQWLVFTVCYFLYSMTNTLHGEPIYKIWSQQLFPANARATATGFTYSLVRLVTAGFGLVTPTLMAWSPTALLWMLVAFLALCAGAACLVLRFIKRHDVPDPLLNPQAIAD